MSWSINAMGMPGAVQANLAVQFANAKHNLEQPAAERATIEAVEMAVNHELGFLMQQSSLKTAVRVTSSGVANNGSSPNSGSTRLSLTIECLPEFLLHERTEESDES